MQLSTGEEPAPLEGEKLKSQANGGKKKGDAGGPSGQAGATQEPESPWQHLLTGLNVMSALLTFVTAVFTWQLLKTNAARVLVCIDIIIFVSVYASLFFLLKKGKPALGSVVNTLLISAFCVMVVITYFANNLPGTAGVGQASGQQGVAQPTVTVTTTVSAAPASPVSTGSQSGSQKGRLLGSYSIELDGDYSVPLGSTKPTQSQFDGTGNNGDLLYIPDLTIPGGGYAFEVTTDSSSYNNLVALPPGSQLSYTACTTPKTFANEVVAAIGVEFCMLEPGRVVGIRVAALHEDSGVAILNITAWQRSLCLARRPTRVEGLSRWPRDDKFLDAPAVVPVYGTSLARILATALDNLTFITGAGANRLRLCDLVVCRPWVANLRTRGRLVVSSGGLRSHR